ncbi:hypothetical protein C3L33_18551, partial [Rhododendron williamsianum]
MLYLTKVAFSRVMQTALTSQEAEQVQTDLGISVVLFDPSDRQYSEVRLTDLGNRYRFQGLGWLTMMGRNPITQASLLTLWWIRKKVLGSHWETRLHVYVFVARNAVRVIRWCRMSGNVEWMVACLCSEVLVDRGKLQLYAWPLLINLGDEPEGPFRAAMDAWLDRIIYASFLVCSEQNDGACWFLKNIKSEIPAESADMTLGYEDFFEGYGDSVWVLLEDGPKVLHDAFFKYQTKPKLTAHGDLYHEGKEFEVKLREMKPGMLSQELKEALGMPEGAPPPWLINMQRYGPPPSYPHLKIPGLNAPIPPGASFGYHPGGWGKPPLDEYGRPLYGDVFGVQQQEQPNYEEEPVDKTKHWGDLEEEAEEEEEEQIEDEELEDGIQSVDSLSSTPTGVETPDVIDLRKQQRKEPEKPLYQVSTPYLRKRKKGLVREPYLEHLILVIGTGTQDKTAAKKVDLLKGQRSDRVDVTLQLEELELMDNVLPAN